MLKEIYEFLSGNYYMVFYAAALILSVYKYKYYYDSPLKTFPIIIAYILLTEVLGAMIAHSEEIQIVFKKGHDDYKHLIYSILDVILFLYFFRLFKKSIPDAKSQKYITYGIVSFIIISAANLFVQDFGLHPQLASMLFGSSLLAYCSITFFKKVKRKMKRFSNYNRLLRHLAIGVIIFYPFYPIIISIAYFKPQLFIDLNLKSILFLLIIAMYTSISIGFISMRRIRV